MMRRIAIYLLLLGAGLIAWFIFSDMAGAANWTILFIGSAALVIGFLMLVSAPTPEHIPPPRFRLLRRTMKKEAEEKAKEKK